jgi:uncharacterized membrane protein YGL010W
MTVTKRVDALLADYGSHHRTRGNLVTHAFGVTLIVFGILSLLHAVPVAGGWTASEVFVGLAFLFYVSLDIPLAVGVAGAVLLLDLAARAVGSWRVGAAAFVVGWILQGIGHAVFEKNSPAFFRNLVHLMVGPAYLVNEALRIRPGRAAPKAQGR